MSFVGPEPKPGDLIEFNRSLAISSSNINFQHWALYVGDGYVVHLTDRDGVSKSPWIIGPTSVVRKDLLETVAFGSFYSINNKFDNRCKPLAAEKVVQAALRKVGEEFRYNVLTTNCEHFVTKLKYGKPMSDQVQSKVNDALTGMQILQLIAGATAFLVIFLVFKP